MFSDVVCPWCHLGHRRLAAALDRVGRDGIELRWRSFQLDPRASREPGELRSALERKYGPGSFDHMSRRLTALGTADGIDFRFDQARRVNTFDAHRLVQWAGARHPHATEALVDRLFRAYFTDGADVGDHDTLAGLAADAGLDPLDAAAVLAGDAWSDAVAADRAAAEDIGVTGVPAVTYNGAVVIPGAQDVDTMALLIDRLRTRVAGFRR